MAELGGAPPKPPGGPAPRRLKQKTVQTPALRGPAPRPPVHAPAAVQVDRAALDRMLDGRKRPVPVDHRGPIGDEDLGAEGLAGMSVHLLAEHLMILLSKKRARLERDEALSEVGELLLSLGDGPRISKVLRAMPEAGKIVDIYPLELMVYALRRRPDLLEDVAFVPFVKNRAALEGGRFAVEEEIRIELPIATKVKQFALEGGGSPGYCFAPGAPGAYTLEVGDAGAFTLLILGEVRKQLQIDRVRVEVVDSPGSD